MDTVFKFLYEFLGQFFTSLWSIVTGIFKGIVGMFDFPHTERLLVITHQNLEDQNG